jgi:hypothetical protein
VTTTEEATMDLTTKTPAEIDELWFPLMDQESNARGRAFQYAMTAADGSYGAQLREQYASKAAEFEAQADAFHAEQEPFRAEWNRREGWVRAYLAVTNGDGHVHRTMSCRTCNRGKQNTQFAHLPQVSGLTDDEIVELAGERACTVCYEDAPVETLKRATRLFSAKLAEKKAKAAAAAITNPDGSTLTGPLGKWDDIRTEHTAWIRAVDITFNHRAYGYEPHLETFFGIITALAAKTGRSFEDIHEEVEARAQAKAKREHVTI